MVMSARVAVAAGLVAGTLTAIAAQPVQGIERVAWMRGCWQTVTGDRTVEEQWSRPAAGTMLGVGRTTREKTLVEYEFVILKEQGERLAYEAHPSGQATATFLSTTIAPSRIVFEDPTHDFPQRVGYESPKADTLLAWIEGAVGGSTRRMDWTYHRVPCD